MQRSDSAKAEEYAQKLSEIMGSDWINTVVSDVRRATFNMLMFAEFIQTMSEELGTKPDDGDMQEFARVVAQGSEKIFTIMNAMVLLRQQRETEAGTK